MDKFRLIKLMRRKTYWERERDKCFLNIFFFWTLFMGFSIKDKNYSGIKKVREIGWSSSSGWERFNCVFDWILIIILVIYLLIGVYCIMRTQTCSSKLVEINQCLLEELNNVPDMDIKAK